MEPRNVVNVALAFSGGSERRPTVFPSCDTMYGPAS